MNKKQAKCCPRMAHGMKCTNTLLLCGVLVPSPPQYFRYSIKQFSYLPRLLKETLGPLNVVIFFVLFL